MSSTRLPPLLALPNDLLWSIGYFLDTADLLRLRHTQRRLGQMAFQCTSTAHLRKASPALIHHVSAQRRRLTYVRLRLTFPPLSGEIDAFVALTQLEHLTTLDIYLEDPYIGEPISVTFDALKRALPVLRFPRLVALRIRCVEIWDDDARSDARMLIVALLEHAHALKQFKLEFAHTDEYQPYAWTPGVAHVLANLQYLEVFDGFFKDARTLPRLEYLCLGMRQHGQVDVGIQDMSATITPNLTALTINVIKGDDFGALPRTLRWLRLIHWGAPCEAFLLSLPTGAPWPFLTTLLLEESNVDTAESTDTDTITQGRVFEQVATNCPNLSTLYVSWRFDACLLVLLTELACALPLLCALHLEVCTHFDDFEPLARKAVIMVAINVLRGALPSRIQLTVSYVGPFAVICQVVEDAMFVHHKWLPLCEVEELIKLEKIVESDARRLTLV
jgi:hypothetical protein